MRRFSPLEIEHVLRCAYTTGGYAFESYNAQQECCTLLLMNGIITLADGANPEEPRYSLTEKGQVFKEMICQTPFPVANSPKWVDPREVN